MVLEDSLLQTLKWMLIGKRQTMNFILILRGN